MMPCSCSGEISAAMRISAGSRSGLAIVVGLLQRQDLRRGPAGGIRDHRGLVTAPGGQPAAIRAERHGLLIAIVAEFAEFLSAGGVPDSRGLFVVGRSGQPAAIGAERHAAHIIPDAVSEFAEL